MNTKNNTTNGMGVDKRESAFKKNNAIHFGDSSHTFDTPIKAGDYFLT